MYAVNGVQQYAVAPTNVQFAPPPQYVQGHGVQQLTGQQAVYDQRTMSPPTGRWRDDLCAW